MTAPNHNLIVEKTNFTTYRKARDPELCETALMTTTSPTEKNGNELSLWPHRVWSESFDFYHIKVKALKAHLGRLRSLDLRKNKNRQHLSQSCLESSRQSHGVENPALCTAVAWASPAGHSHMNWSHVSLWSMKQNHQALPFLSGKGEYLPEQKSCQTYVSGQVPRLRLLGKCD